VHAFFFLCLSVVLLSIILFAQDLVLLIIFSTGEEKVEKAKFKGSGILTTLLSHLPEPFTPLAPHTTSMLSLSENS
jgi:hypothetical protein